MALLGTFGINCQLEKLEVKENSGIEMAKLMLQKDMLQDEFARLFIFIYIYIYLFMSFLIN